MLARSRLVVVVVCLVVASSVAKSEVRTWTDGTGKHKVRAELTGTKDGKVSLRKENGKLTRVPLGRLSEADQKYVRNWIAARKSTSNDGPPPVAQTKGVARKFFKALVEEKLDDAKSLLSTKAQANWESVKSQLESIEVPGTPGGIYVRTAKRNEDLVEVNVNLRVGGQFNRTKLQLRGDEGTWRVVGFIPDAKEESVTSFESGDGESSQPARSGRGADEADEDEADDTDEDKDEHEDESELADDEDDPFRVPEGSAEELSRFVADLKRMKPPRTRDRGELLAFQNKLLTAMVEATDLLLEMDLDDADTSEAASTKLQALAVLARSGGGGDAIATQIEQFPKQLSQLGLTKLSRSAKAVALSFRLSSAKDAAKAKTAITAVRTYAKSQSANDLGRHELAAMQSAASLAERIDDKLAASLNREFGELLMANAKTRRAGEMMQATARRLGLVGNALEITGVTSAETPFDLEELKGKVVLVDFWATWCGPCMAEMPNIKKNYELYHDRGFEVVAISVDRDLKALERYLEKESPPWTVLVDEHPENKVKAGDYYGVNAIPTTVLVGADGKVITFDCRGRQLGEHLKRLLGQST